MSRRSSSPKGWLAHYRELIGTWARRSSSAADAEDAAHDAIAGMLERDGAVIANPRAYLHRSTSNGLAGRYRREQAFPAAPLHELSEAEHPVVDDVEAAARLAQLTRALAEALDELPLACQQVFAWHRIEGRTMPEIAARMGLSVSTVEKYLTRTMRHLHRRLQRFSS
ncbi:sigma-70 family RNA polymerase sigma factor [Pusillimonas caeni]|uniref:sigma-70 family RNA polymerase sigma factor n=1 Tax=Pusillimonas caeni TaxID=1348472 RepID=UPI000E59CEA1|nr:sigma-70 family RNA polymerase sigma factor [Pusillimonas caeni]TFL11532.1 sigma-70 family RNA polymerase sigma factor [Pusillimonas caeni]